MPSSDAVLILLLPPEDEFPPPVIPFAKLFKEPAVTAAAANPPRVPGVEALLNPNIDLTNFSAGIKNPIATNAYIGFCTTKFVAEETKAVYNTKCKGCIIAFIIYSLNHIVKACALLSPNLSIGYVIATSGAIIVKNAIYKNLLKYVNVNITV